MKIRYFLSCITLTLVWLLSGVVAQQSYEVSGIVLDVDEPVGGAVIRIQATGYFARTQSDGTFTIGLPRDDAFVLTAWAPRYFIVRTDVVAGQDDAELILIPHSDEDNPDYEWLSAYSEAGEDGNCQNCHDDPDDEDGLLPFAEWQADAHSQSALNPRFLTMYTGTDVNGNRSPLTRYGFNRDYGSFPLAPDLLQPYYGPGYQLDFPDTDGNCATCHAPAAAVNSPYGTNPIELTGVATEGIGCDFCHKIWDVRLDPLTGLPYPNMPGVLSYEFRRPPEGHQFFAGPYDDVALEGGSEDTYLPLQTQSQFCASCHFGVFWNVPIYNSYGEWLDSPYSDEVSGQTCQDCHMPPAGTDHFALFEVGGLERDPATIFSHQMPGALDEELLQNTISLELNAVREGDLIHVEVSLTNTGAGHHVPTDSPLRQMILIVETRDENSQPLIMSDGSILPDWTGDLSGLPGIYYAKILQELWTEVTPSGAYWMPTQIVEDTRLVAFETRTSLFVFEAPFQGSVEVEARVVFRRAYYDLMQWKGWDIPDIIMENSRVIVP